MASTTVRIRTSAGVKRMVLQGLLNSLTVGDLKGQIISENIFSDRGEDFGLKMEGRRKNISLDDLGVTLESIEVVDGAMFIVDFHGGIRAEAEKKREIVPVEDLFEIPETEKKIPKARKEKPNDSEAGPRKKSKPAAAVAGQFDVNDNDNVNKLVRYFLDNDIGPEGTKELGSCLFNQFISAARMDALTAGTAVIAAGDDGASRSSSSSSSSSNSQGRIHISFRSIAGKLYEESCNPLSEETIIKLILLVLEKTSTKRRRNVETTRNKFSVASLASRAPWVLWPLVQLYGVKYHDCQSGINDLLGRALVDE